MQLCYYTAMLRLDRKNRHSRTVCRGGVIFQNSILQSLRVNNFVRNRARKMKCSEVPIRCATVENCNPVHKYETPNAQQTLGKCVTRTSPKENCSQSMSRKKQLIDPPVVPLKFFCLPFFDSQLEPIAEVLPQGSVDASRFLFFDLNLYYWYRCF